MSRPSIASLLAALAFVGCDDSTSSTSPAKTTDSSGICDSYKGDWVNLTTTEDRGVIVHFRSELHLGTTEFTSGVYETFGSSTLQLNAFSGTLRDLGDSTLLLSPTSARIADFFTRELVPTTDPEAWRPETLAYSFPDEGSLLIGPKNRSREPALYSCDE